MVSAIENSFIPQPPAVIRLAKFLFFANLRSQEWKFIPEEERREIGLTFDDDGEFW